ncbi:MAG TPA: glycerate kinase [Conexibacter sp.]|jgi:glycerate kinase|nr:glycerate kinase [Conexibacter sp.]
MPDRRSDEKLRVLVAPDSFKGTFAAPDVADAIARGLERAGLAADRCPVADGGEGTLDAIVAASGGTVVAAPAHDPLGRPLEGRFALLGDRGTALVEAATASGLALLTEDERDPWEASTFGTGELICAALDAGAREVLVAVGGSATVDGGAGALAALSARGDELAGTRVIVLCDVRTPWERCAEVYGPQKGADAATMTRLAARLDAQAAALPRDPRGVAGTGAAGGLSGALWAVYDAALEPGAARVLDTVGFDARLAGVVAVTCGEGRIDVQSGEGKIVGEISARAARAGAGRAGIPVHALVGRRALDEDGRRALGLASITEVTTLAELEAAGEALGRALLAQPIPR